MKEQIDILILSVSKTSKNKTVLEYAVVDLKESSNRKGYMTSTSWFDDEKIFNKIKSEDIGQVFQADVVFDILSNNQVRMRIVDVYN